MFIEKAPAKHSKLTDLCFTRIGGPSGALITQIMHACDANRNFYVYCIYET